MKKLFLCFLILISCTTYAVDPIDFATATPAEVRAYNLKRQQEYIQKTDKSFADLGKKINQVKASVDGPHIKQVLEQAGVLSDGSKVNVKTVVTQPVDKAKVASTLTERLKNSKEYAKNLGKASIPTFVGMAAFHGLMEGIGWVMDEGGKVTKPASIDPNVIPNYPNVFKVTVGSSVQYYVTEEQARSGLVALVSLVNPTFVPRSSYTSSLCTNLTAPISNCATGSISLPFGTPNSGWDQWRYYSYSTIVNPTYDPNLSITDDPIEVDSSEIQIALQQALLNNNAMQAAMIAQAIKDAYSYDGSEGQKPSSNTLVKEAVDDMAEALPKAFDNPVPTSNPERPSGYYKLTDGEKTVEGYVTPAPVGGTTDTTTTPTIDPVTGQPTGGTNTSGSFELPAFCDWAAVVCDFIDWVREEPEIDEPEVPFKDIERQEIRDDLLTIGGTACPADIHANFTGLPFGISINKTVEMRPYCDVLEPLKYVFSLLTICLCAFMFLRL